MKKINMCAFFVCLLLLSSCSSDIDKVYNNKEDIIQTFRDISIYRRGESISLTFYKDSLSNSFSFEPTDKSDCEKGTYELISDSIQFKFEDISEFPLGCGDDISECLKFYKNKLDAYNILEVTSEFKKFGIDLKLYLKDTEVIYVSNIESIKNSQWLNYIKSTSRIDDKWYWRKYHREPK